MPDDDGTQDPSGGSKSAINGEQNQSSSKEESHHAAPVQFNAPFDKLTGEENWADWRMLMELYLGDLFVCTMKDPPPEALADRTCKIFKEDLMARQKISFGIDKSLVKYLRGANTAHQAWSKLCHAFEDKGVFRRASLLRKMVHLKQEGSLTQYVLDFREVVNQIADTGKAMEDEMCSVLLMANVKPVHKAFCQIVVRTCQTKLPDGTTTLDFNTISEELLIEGNKIKSEESPAQNQNSAKSAQKSGPGKSRDGSWNQHGHRDGGRSGNSRRPSGSKGKTNQYQYQQKSKPKSDDGKQTGKFPPCIHCSKTNHPASICFFRHSSHAATGGRKRKSETEDSNDSPKKREKQDDSTGPPRWVIKMARRGRGHKKPSASYFSSDSGDVSDSEIAAQVEEIDKLVNENSNKIIKTYLDSGAFASMSPEITCFHNYKPIENEPVECAGDQILYTQGKGTLKLSDNASGLKEIQNVTYVPGLTSTLLSISAITKNNLIVVFEGNRCGIFHSDSIKFLSTPILETTESNGTYCLDLNVQMNNKALKVAQGSQAVLWHKRLAHMSTDYMKLMNKGLVNGMVNINLNDLSLCEICQKAKSGLTPFPKDGAHRKVNILDLIHTDVCEITDTPSIDGYRYFVTFIDDKTRYTMVGLIKTKDEVLEKFKEFRQLVQNQTGKTIKAIRSDNGKEYLNKAFFDYLKSEGIMSQFSTPYCPQQNGVSERANRTLQEKMRAMLKTSGLSMKYWPEALQTAVFLKNISPTKALSDMVPYEAWTGVKPDISHLRVFGCCAYVHIRKEKTKKLGDRSRTCILVGYDDERKAYRLLDPTEPRKVFPERNVVFNENLFPALSKGLETPQHRDQETVPILPEKYIIPSLSQASVSPTNTSTCGQSAESDMSHVETTDSLGTNTVAPDGSLEDVTPHFWSDCNPPDLTDTDDLQSSTTVAEPDENTPLIDNHIRSITNPEDVPAIGKRVRKPKRYPDYIVYGLGTATHPDRACLVLPTDPDVPASFKEVQQSPECHLWVQAMGEELNSFAINNVWTLEDLPAGAKVVGNKWVYKKKQNADGTVLFRARLVAKGFTQTFGIDYHDTFAPVVRGTTLRLLFATAVSFDLKIGHIDIKTAFLYGDIEETVYMAQPEGFVAEGQSDKVCRLNKAVYGLKQAARSWNAKADKILKGLGYRNLRDEPCIYIKETKNSIIIIALYVDDFYVFYSSDNDKSDLVRSLRQHFVVKDLGEAQSCLGMKIERDLEKGVLTLHQENYINDTLVKFRMATCTPANTPMETKIRPHLLSKEKRTDAPYQELIGRLIYLSITTRPDIAFCASFLSQFNKNYTEAHWNLAKRVLRYLKQTAKVGLTYTKPENPSFCIIGYADADFAENSLDYKSYSGYCFSLDGNLISWESRKQKLVAQSSTESEYISVTEAVKESIYLNDLVNEIFHCGEQRITVFNDNLSALRLAYSEKYSARTKHFGVRIQLVRDCIGDGSLILEHMSSKLMPADFLTKSLNKVDHEKCCNALKIKSSD